MKIVDFLEKPRLIKDKNDKLTKSEFESFNSFLKSLESENTRQRYKRKKSSLLRPFLPLKNEKEFYNRIQNVDFEKTDYAIIPLELNPNLLVIDCDNVYSAEYMTGLIQQETLITRSPYGAHIYFYYDDSTRSLIEKFQDFKQREEDVDADPVQAALKSQFLKIEIYTQKNKGNKYIFDGNNNSYYRRVSNTATPALITLKQGETLAELFINTKKEVLPQFKNGKVQLKQDREKGEFLKECLALPPDKKIDPGEFIMHYASSYTRFQDIEEMKKPGNRNNALKSIWGSFACIGYIDKPQDVYDFVLRVAQDILDIDLDAPRPEGWTWRQEIQDTIFRNGQAFEKEGFLTTKDVYKLERKLEKQNKSTVNPLERPLFIAINRDMTKGTNKYLLVDFRNLKKPSIEVLYGLDSIQIQARLYPELFTLHYRLQKVEKKNEGEDDYKLVFSPNTCPIVSVRETHEKETALFIQEGNLTIINLNFFSFNPNINKVLNEVTDLTEKQIIKDYEQTVFYKIICRNHLYDPNIREWFLANLKDYILTGHSYRSTMLTIKDVLGNTGKDSVLTPFLGQVLFGDPVTFGGNPDMSLLPPSLNNIRTTSAEVMLEDRFTPWATTRLLVINEDGGTINQNKFNTFMQRFLKNDKIEIRLMQRANEEKPNKMFVIRYTNTETELIDKSKTNTRQVIVEGKQEVTEEEWDEIFKDFQDLSPAEAGWAIAKRDEIAFLRYLLLVFNSKVNPRKLPENATIADSYGNEIESVDQLANISAFDTGRRYVEALVNYCKMDPVSNIPNIITTLPENHLGNILARILATLYFRKTKHPKLEKGTIKDGELFYLQDSRGVTVRDPIRIHEEDLRMSTITKLYYSYFSSHVPIQLRYYLSQQLTTGSQESKTRLIWR